MTNDELAARLEAVEARLEALEAARYDLAGLQGVTQAGGKQWGYWWCECGHNYSSHLHPKTNDAGSAECTADGCACWEFRRTKVRAAP